MLKPGQTPDIRVTVTNLGKKTATLVQPGDGSDDGWRTPLFAWSILAQSRRDGKPYRVLSHPEATDKSRHLSEPIPREAARCGNINALKPDEVFDIAPGQTKEIRARRLLHNLAYPGMTYRVVFLYKNIPSLKWQGVPLGTHDPKAMKRVKNSTPCSVVSNELVFTTPIGAK